MIEEPLTVGEIRGRVDFAIITIREDEFEAVLRRFVDRTPVVGARQCYEYSRILQGTVSECGLVIVRCLGQGHNTAQSVTRDVIDELDPCWILLVGIAGAIPDNDFTLGDVLLASRVHDFSVSAAFEGGRPEHQQTGGPMHADVEKLLATLPAWRRRLGEWNCDDSLGCATPCIVPPDSISTKRLYGSNDTRRHVMKTLKRHFSSAQRRQPHFHIGPVATANTLLMDTELLANWQESARHLTHVEMETGGAYEAARHGGPHTYPLLCVRGISDIVGFRREPEWTLFACHSAASFTHSLLMSGVMQSIQRHSRRIQSSTSVSNANDTSLSDSRTTTTLRRKTESRSDLVDVTIGCDWDDFGPDEERQLLDAIRALKGVTSTITLVNKRKGSVVVTLRMTSDSAKVLHDAVSAGALQKEGVIHSATRPVGLQLTLTRDYASKLHRDEPTKSHHDKRKACWNTVGPFDLMQITPVYSFDDLSRQAETADDVRISLIQQTFLFPASESQDFDAVWPATLSPQHSSSPLVTIVSITLSPALFELGDDYRSSLLGLEASLDVMAQVAISNEIGPHCFFRTLGSADLVVIASPSNPRQLRAHHEFIRSLRQLRLAQIIEHIPESERQFSHYPGHACVSVESTLGFNTEANSVYETAAFRTAETEVGFKLDFQIRADCGHEDDLAVRIRKSMPDHVAVETVESPTATTSFARGWSDTSVAATFLHFADFVQTWNDTWFDLRWRESNLIDTTTEIAFRDLEQPNLASSENEWQLSSSFVDELESIHTTLDSFATKYLGHTQRRELMGLFHSFRSCFYRYELFHAARDLLPLFSQLRAIMSHEDLWKSYFHKPDTEYPHWTETPSVESFTSEIVQLLQVGSRSVRNRIESRSELGDPSVPSRQVAFPHLIGAYTVVFYLVWELFQRSTAPSGQGDACVADNFAACLCAGSEGRVICDELFGEFRRHAHSEVRRLEHTDARPMSARILLLDVSGQSTSAPQSVFIQCLREASARTDWSKSDNLMDLRVGINGWILSDAASILTSIVVEQIGEPAELLEQYCTALCMSSVLGVEHGTDEGAEGLSSIVCRMSPEEFVAKVWSSLLMSGDLQPTLRAAGRLVGRTDAHLRDLIRDVIRGSREFISRMSETKQEFVGILLKDIGMWTALDHVLTQSASTLRSDTVRVQDVNACFDALIRAAREAEGQLFRPHPLIHRWAIQAAAVSYGGSARLGWRDAMWSEIENLREEGVIDISDGEVQSELGLGRSADTSGRLRTSLIECLTQFAPYGGSIPIRFPDLSTEFAPAEQQLFQVLSEMWAERDGSQAKIRMAYEFWAKSCRLRFNQLLEPSE